MTDSDVVLGMERLRRSGRASVSRVLHDEIGPSLCGAGLMLGLLRAEAHRLPPEGQEWLDGLQAALESAMEAARQLSYRTDPGLAGRCGMQAALEYLARGTELSLDFSTGLPDWTVEQSEAACGIVRDFLLVDSKGAARLETSKEGMTFFSGVEWSMDGPRREALRLMATLHRLELLYEVPIPEAIFSLLPSKVR